MPGDRDLAIRVQADVSNFISGMKSVESQTRETGEVVTAELATMQERSEEFERSWGAIAAAFVGLEIVEAFKKIGEAASEAAGQIAITANTMKNLGKGGSIDDLEGTIKKLASSAQGGGYGIDQIRNAFQQFASVGANSAQSLRLYGVAANLAAARNMDLDRATRIVTLAASGHVAMLGRYGINVKDAAGKTVDFTTAVERMEKAFSGDAAIRADELTGAFERLEAAGAAIAEGPFGQTIATVFTDIANTATRLVTWISQLPAPVLQAAAGFAVLAAGAVVVGGAIAALALITGPLEAGIALITGAVETFIAALGTAAEFVGGAIAAFVSLDPVILLLIAGFAALAYGVSAHMDEVKTIVDEAVSFVINKLGELISAFGQVEHVAAGLAAAIPGVGGALSGMINGIGSGADKLGAQMQKVKTPLEDIAKLAQGVGNSVGNWFKGLTGSTAGNMTMPKVSLAGLGGPAAGGKSASDQKELNELFKEFEDRIKEVTDEYAQLVAHAKDNLSIAQDQLKLFDARAAMEKDSERSADEYTERQKLISNEIAKQRDVSNALVGQRQALIWAAQQEDELASQITSKDKEQLQHQRDLLDAAQKHRDEASKINDEYRKVGVTLQMLQLDIQKNAQAAADWAQGRAVHGAQETATRSTMSDTAQIENLQSAASSYKTSGGRDQNKMAAYFAEQEAALQADIAAIKLHEAQEELAAVEANKHADKDAIEAAQDKVTAAYQAQVVAMNNAAQAVQKFTSTLTDRQQTLATGLDALIKKLNVPGLNTTQGAAGTGMFGSGVSISLNPMQMLLQVIMQTKSFGDIVKVVAEIMKTLAAVLDVLKPIIDMLLHVLIFWVNVIISIIDLFGFDIPKISQNFDDLNDAVAPLIEVFHKVPTLNELATGKLNSPISATGVSSSSMPGLVAAIGDKIVQTPKSTIASSIAAAGQQPTSALAGGGATTATYEVNVINPTASTAADASTLGHAIGEAVIQRMRTNSSTLDRVRP